MNEKFSYIYNQGCLKWKTLQDWIYKMYNLQVCKIENSGVLFIRLWEVIFGVDVSAYSTQLLKKSIRKEVL